MDIIASLMVLPNRMCIPLVDQVKVDLMRFPLPRVCLNPSLSPLKKKCFCIGTDWVTALL